MINRIENIGNATLHLADCRDVLPTLKAQAVLTDPPYGIDFEYATHDDNEADWFRLMDQVVPLMRAAAQIVIMPSCRFKALQWWYTNHKPDWLIAWYKGSPGHLSAIGFSDWEPHLVWGKPPRQMHDYFQTPLVIDKNGHPCPKPIAYVQWLISRASTVGGTVIDPFMGSGTTGVACAQLGRSFVGIEIDPVYFDIACERIRRAEDQGRLFADVDIQDQLPLDITGETI